MPANSAITIICPNCRRSFAVGSGLRGGTVRCACGNALIVPLDGVDGTPIEAALANPPVEMPVPEHNDAASNLIADALPTDAHAELPNAVSDTPGEIVFAHDDVSGDQADLTEADPESATDDAAFVLGSDIVGEPQGLVAPTEASERLGETDEHHIEPISLVAHDEPENEVALTDVDSAAVSASDHSVARPAQTPYPHPTQASAPAVAKPASPGWGSAMSKQEPKLKIGRSLPQALAMPERVIQTVAMVVGIPLGIGLSAVIAVTGHATMLGQVFNLHRVSSIIPFAIMSMFCWSLLLCVLRLAKTVAIESVASKQHRADAVADIAAGFAEQQAAALGGSPLSATHPLYRRMNAVLQQWVKQPGLHDADILLQSHENADADTIHSEYSLVRTFIWAMPVLGLIGTVIGISLAVGGFASFLGGGVEDVDKIKTSLVGVTSGLSFAFLITLEGLLGSLLVMLPTTLIQSREESFNTLTQRYLTDDYLPALASALPEKPIAASAGTGPNPEMLDSWRTALREIAAEVVLGVGQTSAAAIASLQEQQQAYRAESDAWIARLDAAIGKVGEQLAEPAGTLERLLAVSSDALALQQSVADAMEALSRVNVDALVPVVAEYTSALREAKEGAVATSAESARMLDAQAGLQQAVAQLEALNFTATLGQFNETLSRLVPLLKMLARPQLVLMASPEDE